MITIKARHHYGASLYPVHASQERELVELVQGELKAALDRVAAKMSKWNGGFDRPVLSFNVEAYADGWDFSAVATDLQAPASHAPRWDFKLERTVNVCGGAGDIGIPVTCADCLRILDEEAETTRREHAAERALDRLA